MELNEQQIDTLLQILEAERIDKNTSESHNLIVNQIIVKVERYKEENF